MSIFPEHLERVSYTGYETACLIDRIAQVFGEPEYRLTPEDNPDSLQEIATYFLPSVGEQRTVYPDISGAVLTIVRTLSQEFPYFAVDLRTYRKGMRQRFFPLPDITEIQIDTERKRVYFFRLETDGLVSSPLGISVQGELFG
ncbi:TPA: hypothetical protein DIV55_00205 [Patescibacteria group bacterium]|uniref:Uncharacterized protein n=1 Tax=Candidatus Gottesmanbacteria bacterium GW2011_GWA1_43_11 TaxID=1618436 RepID=A0A0G1ES26_9BACT|nr:MAG: hypothetical protein UV59_C0004G0019 [Candidatus Gottesmanbacteria bacterium GW2011_GWA1_43_11]HCS78148.1 hypothetical protein [Patescibacteria group bacterium]